MSYKTKFNHIKSFVFDVDGVLTNSQMLLMPDGSMTRGMNVKDGYAIKFALNQGYSIGIISGGKDAMVAARLEKLGIDSVFINVKNKEEQFNAFCESKGIKPKEVLFMGDDLPDYALMQMVGLSTCPADAVAEIRQTADYISHFNGGQGCVRDVIEQTLKAQQKWTLDLHITSDM